MREVSRTKRTIQNSRMSFLLFLVQLGVGFFSRKIFLDYLGTEVLGLNTTLSNILSFMNLAELGIGIAMATSLYKPLHEKDQEAICEIITVEGILFRRVARALCGMGLLVMCILPWVFPNTNCGLLYVYVAFLVFLCGSINGYLWNYKQVLISADQKNYKLLPWIHFVRYVVVFLQIISLMIFHWGVWGWLWWEFMADIAYIFVINYILHREYPWLKKSPKEGGELLQKYHYLIVKTKQLFVHKIAAFVLEQTPPLIIYAFVSLTMVTFYGNYMMIVGYLTTFVGVIFSGMGASIGSLVAENDKKHTLDVFWELLSSRIWVVGVVCYGLFVFMEPFISLWIGSEYVLNKSTFLLIILGAFVRMSRPIIDSFKEAYQLFGDVWAPVFEAVVNLGGSLILGYFFGLDGVLLGSNISLILIVIMWKPYYLFKFGIKSSCFVYYSQYILYVIILFGCAVISQEIRLSFYATNGFESILLLIPNFLLFTIVSYSIMMVISQGMRRFSKRVILLLSHKNDN